MLDMGFLPDVKKVLALLPQKKQSLLFSATFSDEIKALADRLLNNPGLIEVARRNQTAELIEQKVHPVSRDAKKDVLMAPIELKRFSGRENQGNESLVRQELLFTSPRSDVALHIVIGTSVAFLLDLLVKSFCRTPLSLWKIFILIKPFLQGRDKRAKHGPWLGTAFVVQLNNILSEDLPNGILR